MVVRLAVHFEDNDGNERMEYVERVLPGRSSVLNLSPKVRYNLTLTATSSDC